MPDTAARALDLLVLLQSRPGWNAVQLAGHFAVSTRTIRHDIERLRALGYPIESTRGRSGHYSLGKGGRMPPLLLSDDEAVALVLGLRVASETSGLGELSEKAIVKLDQVLPDHIRARASAVASSISKVTDNTRSDFDDPRVDADVLSTISAAIDAHEWLRFAVGGEPQLVEPYRLVTWERRWFLVACDVTSGEWHVHRVDYVQLRMPTRRPFEPRPFPGGDYSAFVMREVSATGWAVHARLTVLAPAEEVVCRIHHAVGVVEAVDDTQCVLVTGSDSIHTLAVYIGMLGLEFRVIEPPELADELRTVAGRYLRASAP